jgi:hypothetical protein
MKGSRILLFAVSFLTLGYFAVRCGDESTTGDCNPACGAGEVCVSGVCQTVGDADGGGEADVTPEAEVEEEAEAMEEAEVAPEVDGDGMGDTDAPMEDGTGDMMEDGGGDAPVRNTGDPCTVDGDCTGPGAQCLDVLAITTPFPLSIPFPGGYCSSSCVGTDPDSCGAGAWCLDASAYGGPTGCVKTCTDASECRESEGYTCSNFMIFTQNFCGPPVTGGP